MTCVVTAVRASGKGVVEIEVGIFYVGFTREDNPAYSTCVRYTNKIKRYTYRS